MKALLLLSWLLAAAACSEPTAARMVTEIVAMDSAIATGRPSYWFWTQLEHARSISRFIGGLASFNAVLDGRPVQVQAVAYEIEYDPPHGNMTPWCVEEARNDAGITICVRRERPLLGRRGAILWIGEEPSWVVYFGGQRSAFPASMIPSGSLFPLGSHIALPMLTMVGRDRRFWSGHEGTVDVSSPVDYAPCKSTNTIDATMEQRQLAAADNTEPAGEIMTCTIGQADIDVRVQMQSDGREILVGGVATFQKLPALRWSLLAMAQVPVIHILVKCPPPELEAEFERRHLERVRSGESKGYFRSACRPSSRAY